MPKATEPDPATSKFIDVREGVLWGDDGDGPEQDALVRDWLLGDDTGWTVAERIDYCATIGRYDVAAELAAL